MLMDSALKCMRLEGDWNVDFVGFFRALLSARAGRIRISELTLGILNEWEGELLAEYLTTCLHLRELVVTFSSANALSGALGRALLTCGSLHHVEVWYKDGNGLYGLSEPGTILLSACGKRNELLPLMLKAPNLTGSSPDGDGDAGAAVNLTDLALFPTLFAAARQAPSTALNNILRGLLAIPVEK
jgi:hypothetical protein